MNHSRLIVPIRNGIEFIKSPEDLHRSSKIVAMSGNCNAWQWAFSDRFSAEGQGMHHQHARFGITFILGGK